MPDEYTRGLERRIASLERKLQLQFAASRSTAPAVDSGPVQTIQGRLDALSLRDGMPVLLNYGFSSSLPVGGDKAVMFLNGDRSQAVVVATGHQDHRFTGLLTGEVVMHDMWGHSIHMTQNGIAMIGNTTLQGNLSVTGNISATGSIIAGYGTADQVGLQTHTHGADSHGDSVPAPTPGS